MKKAAASMALLLTLLMSLCAGPAEAQMRRRLTPVVTCKTALFLLSASLSPPPSTDDWQEVSLPDDWHLTRPGTRGIGWYRCLFTLPTGPYPSHTIYLPRENAVSATFFLNGQLLAGTLIQGEHRALNWDQPLHLLVSPGELRPGENELDVRVEAIADLRQGLPEITFGPSVVVVPKFFLREALQVDSLRMFGGASLLIAVLAFAFWIRGRNDRVMFWFGATALAWALMALPPPDLRLGISGVLADAAVFPLRFGYIVPLLVLCLRFGGKRVRWLELTIWGAVFLSAAAITVGTDYVRSLLITAWGVFDVIALAGVVAWLVRYWPDTRDPVTPLIGATAIAVPLACYDLGRWLGWVDYDAVPLAHFHVPVLLFAIGAVIVRRHFRAIDEVALARQELEARVEQKTQEIAASYARLRQAEQDSALASERNRIMADMHDGVGASLVGLLSIIRGRRAQPEELERRVSDALVEMRLVVDSLEPVNRDVGVVLGNVRHRLREAINASGVKLRWQVGMMPPLDYLTPTAVLAVEHILLEAIVNALRHAGATTIFVRTEVIARDGALSIEIADDGRGFDATVHGRGRGLGNMRGRARSLPGKLDVQSTDAGTIVRLLLPLQQEGDSDETSSVTSAIGRLAAATDD